MEKRRTAFLITVIGVFVIIFSSTFIKFSQSVITSDEDYIKSNLITLAKKCVLENKCLNNIVKISDLIRNDYINDELKDKIKDYSTDSYIIYQTNNVVFIKAD